MKKYKFLGLIILLLALLLGLCWGIRGIRLLWLVRPSASFPLSLKWQVDLGNSTHDLPVYQDGLVILPANTTLSSYWYGVEAATGQVRWSRINWSQRLGFRNYLRCLNTEFTVVSGPWSLLVLNTQTGEIVWKGGSAKTATCNSEQIFTILSRGGIQSLDLSTGQELWSGTNPEKNFYGLAYDSEVEELIAESERFFYLIDLQSSNLLGSFAIADTAPTNRSWERGSLYLVDRGQLFIGGTVVDAKTGEVLYKEDIYSTFVPPTVTKDRIYLSDTTAGVIALDRATFEVKWTYLPQRKLKWMPLLTLSPVTILDGVGYVIFSDATLRTFDLETGQEVGYWQPGLFDLWRWPICAPPIPGCSLLSRTGLAASEDTLFVSFGDGKLYAFGKGE